ncbi:lysis protein [Pseudomonas oryzihabitans]|uniref:Lysis protein n=1 Tax=Pseudomonas oryzihabitans TaxID=47885 RepID=A0A2Z5AA22_9PSED|nr:lysis protein [Pseudomonas oryzihabitans]AXA66766.1 lysis protein [Pseudomonas oryzihabitans]
MNVLFEQYRTTVLAVAVVVLLAVGAGIGWSLNGWRLSGQVAEAKAETANERSAHQTDLTAISNAAAQQVREALAKQQEAQQAVAALDRKHTEEMQNAKYENDRLRGDVADGRRRLQLKASCSADSRNLPNATGAASLDDGAGPRLDGAAERDYWRLRNGIATALNQIAALQSYIKTACLAR